MLYVGRLSREKGIYQLIDAFKIFHKKNKKFKLNLVGTGGQKESIKNYILLNELNNSVNLIDWTNNLNKFYLNSKALILPSYFEGFGNVLVEALSYSLPCISVKNDGPKEILKNGKMEALNNALFGYINNGLNTLPTSEQIYDPARFFIDERYEELTSKTIELDNYILIDEGSFGALDLVYLMQDKIGQTNAINAAVGIGGGSWKDYEDSSGNLLMTLKLTGDDKNELQEIYEAFTLWANAQSRFSSSEPYLNGSLFKGSTNFWIYSDQSFIRIVLSQDLELLNSISDQLNEF